MGTNEPLFTADSAAPRLAAIGGGWQFTDGWLVRTYQTDGWRSTQLVVGAIAFLAEAGNHHPDLSVHYDHVEVRLQTHSAGGVSEKDLQLAERIEATVQWRPNGGFPGLEGQAEGWIKP